MPSVVVASIVVKVSLYWCNTIQGCIADGIAPTPGDVHMNKHNAHLREERGKGTWLYDVHCSDLKSTLESQIVNLKAIKYQTPVENTNKKFHKFWWFVEPKQSSNTPVYYITKGVMCMCVLGLNKQQNTLTTPAGNRADWHYIKGCLGWGSHTSILTSYLESRGFFTSS